LLLAEALSAVEQVDDFRQDFVQAADEPGFRENLLLVES
jgi:hypothetical protein